MKVIFMVMPNFLVIGAAKSGTSSFYNYLKAHPQIYMSPIKEPRFFDLEGEKINFKGPKDIELMNKLRYNVNNIDDYMSLFNGVSSEKAIGEASPTYLYSPKSPAKIRNYIPSVKLIAILRNPIDRAYSNYMMMVRDKRETLSNFKEALSAEEERIKNNWGPLWHYKNMGFYSIQLKRYLSVFDRSQIKIFLYEDFSSNPLNIMKETFQFLGVDDNFSPDVSKKFNVSSNKNSNILVKFLYDKKFLRQIIKQILPLKLKQNLLTSLNQFSKKNISKHLRKDLVLLYKNDIMELEKIIKRDLGKWMDI
ncbi:MAG: sulfotransferase [Desulfobacterales bacterium]|nr:sulfotransferase [Desulfobacterales bacterium]